jgi:hypothetical protein
MEEIMNELHVGIRAPCWIRGIAFTCIISAHNNYTLAIHTDIHSPIFCPIFKHAPYNNISFTNSNFLPHHHMRKDYPTLPPHFAILYASRLYPRETFSSLQTTQRGTAPHQQKQRHSTSTSNYIHYQYIIIPLQPFVGPWPIFKFLNLLGLLGRGISSRKTAIYTQNNTDTE